MGSVNILTLKMSRLFNWLLYFIQYYEIFYGLSYFYANIEKHLVKFYKFIKIYVYFINLIHTIILIDDVTNFIMSKLRFKHNGAETLEFLGYVTHFGRLLKLIFLIEMRVKEENFFKKWHELLATLQSEYFDKVSCITTDKMTERFQIFNILLIFVHFGYGVYRVIYHLYYGGVLPIVEESAFIYFTALDNYILFHHSLILSLIAKWFAKLNYKLRNEDIEENSVKSYLILYRLLENLNIIYGKIVFIVLSTQLVEISVDVFSIFQFWILLHFHNTVAIWAFAQHTTFGIHIFLYYLICERVNRTENETGGILMEYIAKKENSMVHVISVIFFNNRICLRVKFFSRENTFCTNDANNLSINNILLISSPITD